VSANDRAWYSAQALAIVAALEKTMSNDCATRVMWGFGVGSALGASIGKHAGIEHSKQHPPCTLSRAIIMLLLHRGHVRDIWSLQAPSKLAAVPCTSPCASDAVKRPLAHVGSSLAPVKHDSMQFQEQGCLSTCTQVPGLFKIRFIGQSTVQTGLVRPGWQQQ
jgi:hypothetical protein